MKKTILTSVLFIAMMAVSFGQSWDKFNYQGVARNAMGEILENQPVGLQITLHSGTAAGPTVYQETHAVTTNDFGLFSLALGGGVVVSGTFGAINWGSDDYFVQVEMDPAGGTTYTDMGTSQLLAVPYALYAENSAAGPAGPAGPVGPAGPEGAVGATGPLVSGTSGQTLRHDGSDWVANSNLYNNGTNVGIGTAVPDAKFHVKATGSEMARFESNNANKWISLYQGTIRKGILWSNTNDIVLRNDATTGNLRFQTDGNNNRVTIDGDGLVGIATEAPVRNLHLIHDRYTGAGQTGGFEIVQSYNGANWTLYASQSTSDLKLYFNESDRGAFNNVSGVYSSVSDKRLKTDFEPLKSMLDKIMLLKPFKYHFKTQPKTDAKNFGLIAQDVIKVFPEVVTVNGDDTNGKGIADLQMVSYTELIPVLISGMQEQQQLIENLQAEIELLKNK